MMFRTEYIPSCSRAEIAHAALQQVARNYREATLSAIAERYHVSLAYVSKCIRKETGQNYKAHLLKRRLDVAARLLRSSDWSIKQIIDHIGYENTSHFYHLFRKRYGQTPQEYRRAYLTAH